MTFVPDHHHADLGDVTLHYVTAGSGKPIVLLHGWPQTWYAWRKIMPELAKDYFVIAPDLRGLGDSSRPLGGFDKKTIGADIAKLLNLIRPGEDAFVVGHDWGGTVAFALAAYHPGVVKKLTILDVAIPGDGSGTFSQNGRRWHHAFHQTLDMPEQLIHGREDVYYRWFYANFGWVRDAIGEEEIVEYLRTYRDFSTLRTGMNYYRTLNQDVLDNEAFLKTQKLQMPILAFGGADAFGRGGETLASMQRVGTNVRGGIVQNCGHWIPEEQPEFLLKELTVFFRE
ncbi:MAG: alpha/beta hydrolase [Afipia sp.]|nr:alpha/beta hydrolase [Afipia sp.]